MIIYNIIKDPHRYLVQEGDATMFHIASLPGQKNYLSLILVAIAPTDFL